MGTSEENVVGFSASPPRSKKAQCARCREGCEREKCECECETGFRQTNMGFTAFCCELFPKKAVFANLTFPTVGSVRPSGKILGNLPASPLQPKEGNIPSDRVIGDILQGRFTKKEIFP